MLKYIKKIKKIWI